VDGSRKSCLSPPEFDPRTDKQIASRYTDWAIPAHTEDCYGPSNSILPTTNRNKSRRHNEPTHSVTQSLTVVTSLRYRICTLACVWPWKWLSSATVLFGCSPKFSFRLGVLKRDPSLTGIGFWYCSLDSCYYKRSGLLPNSKFVSHMTLFCRIRRRPASPQAFWVQQWGGGGKAVSRSTWYQNPKENLEGCLW